MGYRSRASSTSGAQRLLSRLRITGVAVVAIAMAWAGSAHAADAINAYSIWPENWARPMLQEFEQATGIKVNFVRFSSGEALARVIAEKGNPRVDVLYATEADWLARKPRLTVYYPGVPDTTPEFTSEAALDAYLAGTQPRAR